MQALSQAAAPNASGVSPGLAHSTAIRARKGQPTPAGPNKPEEPPDVHGSKASLGKTGAEQGFHTTGSILLPRYCLRRQSRKGTVQIQEFALAISAVVFFWNVALNKAQYKSHV